MKLSRVGYLLRSIGASMVRFRQSTGFLKSPVPRLSRESEHSMRVSLASLAAYWENWNRVYRSQVSYGEEDFTDVSDIVPAAHEFPRRSSVFNRGSTGT